MTKVALFVQLKAKPGKEEEVAGFLKSAQALLAREPLTVAWFAVRFDKSTFGIFDAFPDESAREAHLGGKVAAALMARAPELFMGTPPIQKLEVVAAKLP